MFKGLARINYLKRLTLYYLFLKEFATIQFIQSRRKVTPDLKLNKTAAFSKAELFFPLVQFQVRLQPLGGQYTSGKMQQEEVERLPYELRNAEKIWSGAQ
ncbi:unnamed protein product [Rhizophagus irregularis]|nr:unnamed protein product [Rhizophagus irregularis]